MEEGMLRKTLVCVMVMLFCGTVCGCSSKSEEVPVAANAKNDGSGQVTLSSTVNDEGGPIFRSLSVSLSTPGGVQVEYWTGNGAHLSMTSDASSSSHVIPLPRLRANATYTYQVKALNAAQGASVLSAGTFKTDPLPDDLAALTFTAQGTATSPMTFLTTRAYPFVGPLVVDSDGYIVWYARSPGGNPLGATRKPNGNWVVLFNTNNITEFSPMGKTVATLPQGTNFGTLHHDVVATSNDTVLFLTFEPKEYNGTALSGEGIWEWNTKTGAVTRKWLAFDFFDPTVDKGDRSVASDWFHANSLSLGTHGNIIVSFHFLDQIISIAPDFKSIEWRLGGPGSTVNLLTGQKTSGQHSAMELSPFDVLVFDNGFDRGDGTKWSRAYQRKFDPVTKTVTSTWEYRPNPDNWARIISSARRLTNGNTVVTFGPSKNMQNTGSTGPVAIHEITADSKLIWSMVIGLPDDITAYVFRGEPITTIGGETPVP
jgi:arylsulfate sulfotransferase